MPNDRAAKGDSLRGSGLRRRALATLSTTLFGLCCAGPALAQAEPSRADLKLAAALETAWEQEDCAAVVKALKPRLGKARIHPGIEQAGFEMGALCATMVRDWPLTNRWAVQGTARHLDASDFLWRTRLASEVNLTRFGDAVRTVEAMYDGRGAALNSVRQRTLFNLRSELHRAGMKAEEGRLLAVLTSSAYAPDEVLASADGFRHRYATILVDNGDHAAARPLVEAIESTDIRIEMLFDPRFQGMMAEPFDERASVEKELAAARTAMRIHDDHLRPFLETAGLLRQLGRFQEALDVLEAARSREGGPAGYADADELHNWWWDSLSRTQMELGRTEAALESLRAGAGVRENSGLNVSQTINLSQAFVALRRPEDALRTLEGAEKLSVSPYGAMMIRATRGCAAAMTGAARIVEADIAYARDRMDDAPNAYLDLLLCANDADGAAAAVIARLDDPEKRGPMLHALADFDPPPPSKAEDPRYVALQKLKTREDVSAALARWGGPRRIRLHDARW